MKQTILLITFLLGAVTLRCQTNAFFSYSSDSTESLSSIKEMESGNILVLGGRTQSGPAFFGGKAVLLKLDQQGKLLDSLFISIPGKSVFPENILKLEDHYVICSMVCHPENYSEPGILFLTIDTSLNLLNSKICWFDENYELLFLKAQTGWGNDLLITGSIVPGTHPFRTFAYRFSPEFDSIIFALIDTNLTQGRIGNGLRQINEKEYLLFEGLAGTYYYLDSLFNVMNKIRIPHGIGAPFGIKWDTDTSFYLAGQYNPPGGKHEIGMIRQYHYADTNGTLLNHWSVENSFDVTASRTAMDYNNKDSIFIGGTSGLAVLSEIPNWCIVLQTDSMLNIRWESFVGGDANYVADYITTTQDGGCLIGATVYDYQNTNIIQWDFRIFKLDQYGQLVGSKEISNIQTSEAIVYPNPGNEHLKIRIAAQHPRSVFALYSIDGKLLFRKNLHGRHAEINASALKPGTYIYKIFNNKGLNESGKWVKE